MKTVTDAAQVNPGKNSVTFASAGCRMAGNLYCPEAFDPVADAYSAVVLGGPMSTVKEQAPAFFAERLAKRGYVALAYDYRRFGESEGEPRCYEDPSSKVEDIQNAVSYLSALGFVDSNRIAALSVCASSSYMAHALIGETRIKAFASVSAHFNLHSFFADNPMVSAEQKVEMLKASNDARQKYYETGEAERNDMIWPDMTGEEMDVDSREIYDYYFARVGECWPNFSNHLAVFSYEQLLRSNALEDAKLVKTPYLGVVGSEAITRPLTEMFLEGKVHGEKGLHVMEGATHMQSYDNPKYVDEAVAAIDTFYKNHLAGRA